VVGSQVKEPQKRPPPVERAAFKLSKAVKLYERVV